MSGSRRAQSEVVGVVLLLGLTITVTGVTVAIGNEAISSTQQQVSSTNAENVLSHVDAKASLVALGSSDRQSVDLPRTDDGRYAVHPNAGRVRVRYESGNNSTEIVNQSLGAVTYTNGDTEIAYQGGGVWRSQGNGTMMVTPPEVHYEDGTLTLPVISVNGSMNDGGGRMTLTQSGSSTVVYPNASEDWPNPLTTGTVYVTIQSDYYRAWGQYFESRTNTKISYNDTNDSVTMKLEEEVDNPIVSGGIVSGPAGDHLHIASNENAIVDSYNSSKEPYNVQNGENTTIITGVDARVGKEATVKGNLITGGDITVQSGGRVTGTVGHISRSDPELEVQPVSGLISNKSVTFQQQNDNERADAITQTWLKEDQSTWRLEQGNYYLHPQYGSQVSLADSNEDQKLILDTSEGPINIVVDGRFKLSKGTNVTVTGPGRVNFYLTGDFRMQSDGTEVTVPGDDSTQLWMFMEPGNRAQIQGDSKFTGVIYGPGGSEQGATIRVHSDAEIYGGLVGYAPRMAGQVHYDTALRNKQVFETEYIATINYLHVTNQTVNVSA